MSIEHTHGILTLYRHFQQFIPLHYSGAVRIACK